MRAKPATNAEEENGAADLVAHLGEIAVDPAAQVVRAATDAVAAVVLHAETAIVVVIGILADPVATAKAMDADVAMMIVPADLESRSPEMSPSRLNLLTPPSMP